MLFSILLAACGTPAAPANASALLAAADAHDGATDHVVSECAGCALGMKGDPAHSAEHDGYTLHFCSDSCRDGFTADPQAGIERLQTVLAH